MSTVTGIRLNARLHGAAEMLPGEYTLKDGATVERVAVTDGTVCPYCRGRLMHLRTRGAMRVAQQLSPPAGDVQVVMAQPVPDGYRVLKCDPCEALFCSPEAGAQ